jgi:ATP-dependent Clp protease, protease subunit
MACPTSPTTSNQATQEVITADSVGNGIVSIYVNKFDEESAKSFFEKITQAREREQGVVPVYIDSYGGSVDALMSMVDNIISFPGHIATICLGKAMSCGVMLLAMGSKGLRFAAPNSRIMIHNIWTMVGGKVDDILTDANQVKLLQKRAFTLVEKNCGLKSGHFIKLLREGGGVDLHLTPQDAAKHKLIDHVRYPIIQSQLVTRTIIS